MIHYLRLTPTSHYLNTEKSECPLGCPFLIQPRGFSHTVAKRSESQATQRGGTKCCAGPPVHSESPTSPLSLTGKLLVITSAAEPACLQKKATPRFVLRSAVKSSLFKAAVRAEHLRTRTFLRRSNNLPPPHGWQVQSRRV